MHSSRSASPAFSVIVAAFNSGGRLEQTMRSVLAQTRADLELIVVDDGSSDDTGERARRLGAADSRVQVVSQPNAGTVAARNRGLATASGRHVSFLDDDDLWLPGYLEAVASCFERCPEAGLAHSDAWVLDAASGRLEGRSAGQRFARAIRRLPPAPGPAAALEALLRVNFITTCAATVSRRALDAVGELDPEIRGCDDWDLWLRIAGAGFRVVRIEERLAVLRKRPDSVGADSLLMARGSSLALRRALDRGTGSPRAEAIARRHLRVVEREIAASGGTRARRWLASASRRLGRKRLPLPAARRGTPPVPVELRATLERVAQPGSSAPAPSPSTPTGSS